MKIYTKTGDHGETSLLSGGRVSKSDLRINAYGSVDELNSFIGYLSAHKIDILHKEFLLTVQNKLYHMGSLLATKKKVSFKIPEITDKDTEIIENEIDKLNMELPPLKNFIIPGGDKMVSICHICRTICRRAERDVVTLNESEKIDLRMINYLNRLSDYFFILARKLAQENKINEIACTF